jgi:hypothetical protein
MAGRGVVASEAPLREISAEDGERLLAIVLGATDSAVTWRRAQIVALCAQRLSPARIAEVVSVEPGLVRHVIDDFNRDGFHSL